MQLFDELNEDNFILYASRNYNNPQCITVEEFFEDLLRVKYLKRLFSRYISTGIIQERLVLNHIIIFYNVFGLNAANKIMKYKIDDPNHLSILKTFLVYLNYIKENEFSDISLDQNIENILKNL